jgi:HK97 family phage major capsid protein
MSDTQTVEIDQKVLDEVANKASESVLKSIEDKIKVPTAEEIATAMVEKSDKTVKKDIHEDADTTKTVEKRLKSGIATLPKEVRFAKAVRAFVEKDHEGMAQYSAYVANAWQDINKSNYQNVTTSADGGALVPDPEFIAEVERLTDDYGTASRLANVRKTDRDSVTLLSGTNEISFVSAAEATAKNATKLTYGADTAALTKYIATLIMTSELVEDSAIDIFQDAANEIARARAKLFDQLVFTDSTYGLITPSIGEAYKTITVGTNITDFDADDAMNAQYKIVTSARKNARYFMHPSVWNVLRQQKAATTGEYLFGGPGQGVTPNIDGYPVELVDVLPAVGNIAGARPFALFGDLSRVKLHVKRVLETKVFDSGVVKDSGGTDYNLITQDSWAMRATLRCVPQTRFPGAFVVLGTGTVS